MKIQELQEDNLKRILEQNYGFQIKKMEYIRIGEDCASYNLTTNKKKLFVQVYQPKYISRSRIKGVIAMLYRLHDKYNIKKIPLPIKNLKGKTLIKYKKFSVALFEFIDGKISQEKNLPSPKILAREFVKLHSINPNDFKQIKQDTLNLRREKKILKLIKYSKENKELYRIFSNKQELFKKWLNVLRELAKYIKKKRKDYVLIHTDAHEKNLMVSGKKLYIIDWDYTCKALPEWDLMFFNFDKTFMKEYKRGMKKFKGLDQKALKFYKNRRRIDDLVFDTEAVLERKHLSEKERKVIIQSIKEGIEELEEVSLQ